MCTLEYGYMYLGIAWGNGQGGRNCVHQRVSEVKPLHTKVTFFLLPIKIEIIEDRLAYLGNLKQNDYKHVQSIFFSRSLLTPSATLALNSNACW